MQLITAFRRLPSWLQGCVVGCAIGSVLFFGFVALFSLTPLHLLVAAFAAWGSSGAEIFSALALPAAVLGAWVGGFFGMPIGAFVGKVASRQRERLQIPGAVTGAFVTGYVFLPNFLDSSTQFASRPATTRALTFVILISIGAFIGFVVSWVRRR